MSQSMTRRARTTRERILDALGEMILEGGLPDFSVQEVADRCGISHRTVYRHFPTRESLLNGLVAQLAAAMEAAGGAAAVETVDDLPRAVAVNFAMFNANASLAGAAVRFSVGTTTQNQDRQQRTDAVMGAVRQLDLGDRDARMVSSALRHLASSRTWLLLREAGLDDEETAATAAWAIEVLIAAVREGRLPSTAVGDQQNPAAP